MVTDPHRPSATDRGDYNTLRRSLARSVIKQMLVSRKGVRLRGWYIMRLTDGELCSPPESESESEYFVRMDAMWNHRLPVCV